MRRSNSVSRLLWKRGCALIFIVLAFGSVSFCAAKLDSSNDVLVLYDSSGPYGWVGEMNARFLVNLLGHFPQSYQMIPVEQYSTGDALHARATFYVGNVYNNPLPAVFLQDIMATSKPVCWFKYNLWQLGSGSSFGTEFETKFGFRFDYMDNSGFTQIEYNGESFSKDQRDPELGRALITIPTQASSPALARQLPSSNSIPYVVHCSNFWYVADSPFTYISEDDRYLVFADLLHDILQRDHPPIHQAIIRLEDVDPTYNSQTLRNAADLLNAEGIPFCVAVIARYLDPLGYYSHGPAVDVPLSTAPDSIRTLKYMVSRGGQIVVHGYTNQYQAVPNPYDAVSADDYEFFRVTVDAQTNVINFAPVPEDSADWAQGRVNAALSEFGVAGLNPVAWETPHYTASEIDYRIFATNFPLSIQRVLYSDSAGHSSGQFFPYTIETDVYGQKLLPENLGNVNPFGSGLTAPRLPADIVRTARKNRVLRDAWASAFFHPYLDISYLDELVSGLKDLGYVFVPLTDQVRPTITSSPENLGVTNGATVLLHAEATGTMPMHFQWQFNETNLPGATNLTFTITNAQPVDAGVYTIVVTNVVGTSTSAPALLQVVAGIRITDVSFSGDRCSFVVETEPGVVYEIEYKNSLSEPQWRFFSSFTGSGMPFEVTDFSGVVGQRFYRVRVH